MLVNSDGQLTQVWY